MIIAQNTVAALMNEVSQGRVNQVLGLVRKSIETRRDYEARTRTDGQSADFEHVEDLNSQTVARFFATVGINPETYVAGAEMSEADWSRKSKLDPACRTRNLKAYKKMREVAEYFESNSRMERVLKAFVACSIISSRFHTVIPRDVCERFLSSVPLNRVSDDLIEAIDALRAKHMSGGAATQTSQCALQLATMRAAHVIRNGRHKDFMLDLESPVTVAFAEKFGLVKELEQARTFRASQVEA